MDLTRIDKEVLQKYVSMRKEVTKRVDRVVAVAHLLGLLKGCDGTVEVDSSALAVVGEMIGGEVCQIQELLDDFIYLVEVEGAFVSQ